MAAITTYATLQAGIKEWLRRDGGTTLDSQIDTFIDMAEAEFNRTLRCHQMEDLETLTMDANGEASLPDDFLAVRSARYSGSPKIELRAVSEGGGNRLNADDSAGTPYFYSISDSTLRIIPPLEDAEVELTYYAQISPLSSSSTVNWLLTLAPDAYLFQSLHYASIFTREFDAAANFKALAGQVLRDVGIVGDLAAYLNAEVTLDFPTA